MKKPKKKLFKASTVIGNITGAPEISPVKKQKPKPMKMEKIKVKK